MFRLWVKDHVADAVNWLKFTVCPPPPPPLLFNAYDAVMAYDAVPNKSPVINPPDTNRLPVISADPLNGNPVPDSEYDAVSANIEYDDVFEFKAYDEVVANATFPTTPDPVMNEAVVAFIAYDALVALLAFKA